MKKFFLFAASAVCLLSGCISYDYQGTVLDTPSITASIYTDSSKVDMKEYTLLGTATASGNSQNVSRDDIFAKLSKKAKACGADTIVITGYQIIPTANGHTSTINASFDSDESNTSWKQIARDVDNNYGNIRGLSNEAASAGSYKRVIKAQFLKRKTASSAVTTEKK